MAAKSLESIDCSIQPLDFSFHPTIDIVAAGLVDGTVEVHDFSKLITKSLQTTKSSQQDQPIIKEAKDDDDSNNNDNESDDEDDTILSSIPIHCNEKPIHRRIHTPSPSKPSSSTGPASSCTSTLFDTSQTQNGSKLYTAGNSGSLCCIDTQRASHYTTSDDSILWKIDGASPHGISTLYQLNNAASTGPLVVTGDEEGVIRLWDSSRLCTNATTKSNNKTAAAFDNLLDPEVPQGCVATFKEHSDYISGFEMDDNGTTLLATSADGTLSIFDIRMSGGTGTKTATVSPSLSHNRHLKKKAPPIKFTRKSDDQDDELLSICKMKNGKKVICGTQNGTLAIWSWGTWGDISDRFPGHPQSIDAMLKVDESTILTGSGDGLVRALQIHPNQLLGVLGDHAGFPVEKLLFSAGRKVVGSLSHDTKIRLWDASILHDGADDGSADDKESDMDEEDATKVKDVTATTTAVARRNTNVDSDDDWDDMDDDDSDDSMDSDSDDDDDVGASNKKGRVFKSENEKFFEDL